MLLKTIYKSSYTLLSKYLEENGTTNLRFSPRNKQLLLILLLFYKDKINTFSFWFVCYLFYKTNSKYKLKTGLLSYFKCILTRFPILHRNFTVTKTDGV